MKLDIKIDELEGKFIALVEGLECCVNYRILADDTWEYYRVFVPEKLRNRGIASHLVEYALTYARDHGKKILATCPYVSAYINRHPSWAPIRVRGEI